MWVDHPAASEFRWMSATYGIERCCTLLDVTELG